MINLLVNSEHKSLAANTTIAEALELWGYQSHEIAVAVNNEFVPRSQYAASVLAADDCIDVVAPVQGG